jgi:hypothetical protein
VSDPTLIIMAGGIGNRYGGLKQVEPVGPGGEILIDYLLYDAIRAGFGKIVFLIRREIEEIFRERIGRSVEGRVETAYVFQELTALPPGFSVPPQRTKPWGTGHAVLSCWHEVHNNFGVINADDFYGPGAFQQLADYLRQAEDRNGIYDYCMVGYVLSNTLSEHGSVSRGVCQVSPDGYLEGIVERTRIERFDDGIKYTLDGEHWIPLPGNAAVSMNMWGFTPSFMQELEEHFPRFLRNATDLTKAEFFLPNIPNDLLKEGKARVSVLHTDEKWFGVTYPADRPVMQNAIQRLVTEGVYPYNLWT